MKKSVKIISITLFVFILLLTGCSKKDDYSDYKHYKLVDFEDQKPMLFTFHSNQGDKYNYAVVQKKDEGTSIYLLYQVNDDKYILLEEMNVPNDKQFTVGYNDNKLYIISDGFMEYSLEKEKITKKKLKFYIDEEEIGQYSISNVENNYIYINAYITGYHNITRVKCSLSSYKCEM